MNSSYAVSQLPASTSSSTHTGINGRFTTRKCVESEVAENRRFLQRVVPYPLEHFCYPSGVYGLHQAEWLAELGVKSATTIEPGLNYATPRGSRCVAWSMAGLCLTLNLPPR